MAMTPGPFSSDDDEVMATINTTPLVDVMLVLLIIFLITIPVVNTSIAVDLPRERHEVRAMKPENIVVSVDAQGGLYWFDTRLASSEALLERLKAVALRQPQPEVHIRGDRSGAYEGVGRVVQACQRAGIAKLAFVTEPPPRP
ncbi:outer membrane transport energization protein ExbD [Sphaerotilus hippei]|uniref:Outer membrane transport energization protein ExbD n=1 Tax=Sphaerotilus hippei TaxID=744406 RepID=A0A318GZW3_9BURK|nr:biopolymer transporter ExbD [Sphaerotilus hippei]PXW95248.1 outer membrane transport energization protein ExbD [Sphaerotilus hippei]